MTYSCGVGVTLCGETWQLLRAVLCGLPCTFWNLLEHLYIGADLWVKSDMVIASHWWKRSLTSNMGWARIPKGSATLRSRDSGQDRRELQSVLGRWECSDRCCGWVILTGLRSNSEWPPISKSGSIFFSGLLQFLWCPVGCWGRDNVTSDSTWEACFLP